MARETITVTDEVANKIRSNRRLGTLIEAGVATTTVVVIAIASIIPPEFRIPLSMPLIILIFGGAGVTSILENKKWKLQSSDQKIPQASVK